MIEFEGNDKWDGKPSRPSGGVGLFSGAGTEVGVDKPKY